MNITAILQYLLHMGADLLDSFLISHKLSLLCAGSLPLCGYAGTFFDVCYVKDIDRQGQCLVDFLHEADKTKAAEIAIHQQVNITFCVLCSLCIRTKQDGATDWIA